MGCSLKNLIFSGGFPKKQYIKGSYPKRGAWTVFRFKGGLAKKREEWCLLKVGGADTLMHTMIYLKIYFESSPWLQ